ncbi:DNA-directed RNA polymerase subunit beta [Nocardia abscessus]|uniref:DNA-directed RNA polymerase subunit beta n=1 Tax=Nocardia abscessus TaxID=120957 RepID=UPI002454DA66|nr:DNA-directed RNA polymerase subunit beta [Nocardia abscessus]
MLKAAVNQVDDATMVLESPTARCRFYRNVCGLPARIEPEGRIFLPCGSVGAITVPAQLGATVKIRMRKLGDPAGPIISHPRSKRWTFLVRPDVPADMPLFTELFRLNATLAPIGAQIGLPSPADGVGAQFRVWAQAPSDSYRPSALAVVGAIRDCVRTRLYPENL